MNEAGKFLESASVYELVRIRPAARIRLSSVGVTNDYLDYRIDEAARALGVPIERITELAQPQPNR
jgi:hypothetical protein